MNPFNTSKEKTEKRRDRHYLAEVYDVLIKYADADVNLRGNFIRAFQDDCMEWRFGGKLGFGGKYWIKENCVTAYFEDLNAEREDLIAVINAQLGRMDIAK